MTTHKSENKTKETTRIEAFSDGVFAIAITLLVLELITKLNPESGEGIVKTCLTNWRSFVAFTVGFITILVCWINHHVAVECISKVDIRFMWINGFLLFVVTLIPFSTAILAEYLEKEGSAALAIFGFNFFLISIAADAICSYAYRKHLINDEHREFYASYKMIYRYGIIYTLIAFFLSFVSITISIFLYILLFTAFAGPKGFTIRVHKIITAIKKK